jgi:hypothetical protein
MTFCTPPLYPCGVTWLLHLEVYKTSIVSVPDSSVCVLMQLMHHGPVAGSYCFIPCGRSVVMVVIHQGGILNWQKHHTIYFRYLKFILFNYYQVLFSYYRNY